MTEFATYDLTTLIMAGSAALFVIFALLTARANRVPNQVRALDLTPSFGL